MANNNRKLLAGSSFWTLNKNMAKYLKSNDAALLLAELCDIHDQHPKEEFIFRKQDYLMSSCNLSIYALRSSVKILHKENLIEVKRKGTPPLNYYKVIDSTVGDILISHSSSFEDQTPKDVESTSYKDAQNSSYKDPISAAYNNKQETNNQEEEPIGMNNMKREDNIEVFDTIFSDI